MFMGEYHHNLDDKNRLILPSKFRDDLKTSFVITRGLESCLFVYSKEEWEKIMLKLSRLSFTKAATREFNRFFLSGAVTVEFDKQGRMNIPDVLKDYAHLTKECTVIGVGDRLEIWDSSQWNDFLTTKSSSMSSIAESLFDSVSEEI